MDDGLLGAVIERLDRSDVDERTEALVLAALEGEEALGDAVESGTSGRPARSRPPTAADAVPAEAFVRSVTVEGFRGIGPAATLELEPGPGLTVVCGRNGSGKSSFAEALEVLVTGNLRRFSERSAVWRDGWRSLHNPATAVSAEFAVAGRRQPVTVRRSWAENAKLADGVASGLDDLGWADVLSLYRPFLSHSELESMLGEPKALHDQLNEILGLDDLVVAGGRLARVRLQADKAAKAPKDGLPAIRSALEALGDDDRAARARAALGRTPDIDVLEAVATGDDALDAGPLAALQALRSVGSPRLEGVRAAAEALVSAADGLAAVAGTDAADAARTASLLGAALDHFDRHGPGDCPVCAAPGRLDAGWRTLTEATVARLRAEAAGVDAAHQAATQALDAARALVVGAPDTLTATDAGVDTGPARAAWQAWTNTPEASRDESGLRTWAAHLLTAGPPLIDVVAATSRAADDELRRRQDLWSPVARQLLVWCRTVRDGQAAAMTVAALRRAETWLKDANRELREERLRPFADRAVALWSELRSESNVDLVGVHLEGSSNQSRVNFEVTVDGTAAAALGVMSQGEVNALALSVFLPRATMPGSPFRFLVIDDPVQAMDPSKVDGMARVLVEVAGDRQVIVFTHDDRLPDAVRRLGLPARIVGVTRRARSVVELHPAGDPVSQILRDARQLTRGDGVPIPVARRVIPGLCRTAIEMVLIDAARRRRLARGERHEDIDAVIDAAETTRKKAALAIFDDADRTADVMPWLNQHVGAAGATTFRTANAGAHGGDAEFDPARLVASAGDLCQRLEQQLV